MRHARFSQIALAVALFAACPVVAQQPYPINLPTAMKLAGAEPLDIAIATARLQSASAQLQKANVLWLPSVQVGADYFRQDGQIQDVVGKVFTTSKSTLMVGAGPGLVFAVSDAIFAPLAARQVVRAQEGGVQAAKNDSLYAVATAYFDVQQARGRLEGSADAVKRAEELLRRVEKLGGALTPAVEINRVRTELARRRQAVESAQESRETAGAELARLLRLPPASAIEPMEPPQLRVDLIDANQTVDDLIPIGLTNRPELAANKALVLATLARLRQEKIRPLIPSLLIRGAATNPAGTLSTGYFGGGVNGNLSNFNARNTVDVQLLWELKNLGFGNRAAVREQQADNERAVLELFRVQDRIAAEVVQAHSQARRAANRIALAEEELTNARITVEKNLVGIGQTRRVGETLTLVFRPQEVVAAIAALDSAYQNYYGAIADANRAQFRLYRALGHPAQCIRIGRGLGG